MRKFKRCIQENRLKRTTFIIIMTGTFSYKDEVKSFQFPLEKTIRKLKSRWNLALHKGQFKLTYKLR